MTSTKLQETLQSADDIQYKTHIKWLNENTVRLISDQQNEPERMLQHRLQSLKKFNELNMPSRWPDLSALDFDKIVYYARAETNNTSYESDREKVPSEIKAKFDRLGIPQAEKKYLAGVGWQFDSQNVYHNIKEKRAKKWVIFEDMKEAITKHEAIVKKYFMKLVPASDHKFAALHWAVRSGGTFIYVPPWVEVNEPLQAYFRMNTYEGWQFEHTLIIIDEWARWDYIEWCSAPRFDKKSLHAWLVEIFVWKNAHMRYSSVENRSTNTYNLNTKRAIVEDYGYMEWVNGNLGSCVTMLYPCAILKWKNSKAESIGVAVAWAWQNQDTGTKIIHIGENSSSTIVSKSIAKDWGIATYRWIVDMKSTAEWAINSTECDALLMDDVSVSTTIPYIKTSHWSQTVAHEASAGKVDETELFYMMSRWLEEEKAMWMIVNGFISPIIKRLPLEYAGELNKLIEMEMEGSVW